MNPKLLFKIYLQKFLLISSLSDIYFANDVLIILLFSCIQKQYLTNFNKFLLKNYFTNYKIHKSFVNKCINGIPNNILNNLANSLNTKCKNKLIVHAFIKLDHTQIDKVVLYKLVDCIDFVDNIYNFLLIKYLQTFQNQIKLINKMYKYCTNDKIILHNTILCLKIQINFLNELTIKN